MQKVIRKRILRNLKSNFQRHFALMLIIMLSMFFVISIVAAADTVTLGTAEYSHEYIVEDGEFSVFVPLDDAKIKEIEDKGVTVEENFYNDFKLSDKSTVRIFKNREDINLVALLDGELAKKNDEIVVEKRYSQEHNLSVGDKLEIAGNAYKITGIGVTPDYEAAFKNIADACVDSNSFGLGWVTDKEYDNLSETGKSDKAEEFIYSYLLNGKITDDDLKEMVKDNVELFIPVEDNSRIGGAADDQAVNKSAGLVAGVVILILVTYVISVFVAHEIDEDSSVIGTLYALGVRRIEILRHYLILPVVVTFLAGFIGMLVGFSDTMITSQMRSAENYFSLPELTIRHPLYLSIYSVVLPPFIAVIVNFLVIYRKLKKTALQLIRRESGRIKLSKLKLKNRGFIYKFFIRQLLREFKSSMTVVLSMFIAMLLLMLGLNIYVMCAHIRDDNKADVNFQYMYTYKIPDEIVPEGGYEACSKTFKMENLGYEMEVSMIGITEDNPFFDVNLSGNNSEVVITSAMAQKFALKVGDSFEIEDEISDRAYTFTVTEIMQYSPSFYFFMDIDSMRELFDIDGGYFNVVFSDKALYINSEKLFATITKRDIDKAADIYISLMWPMIYMIIIVSIIVFVIVMFLMMKMMLDRSACSISLIQIFGYRTKEIRKLYLDGNFLVVAIGGLIAIPIAKIIMDAIYPYTVADAASAMVLEFPRFLYLIIYAGVLILYFIINRVLVFRIKKIKPTDILKSRE